MLIDNNHPDFGKKRLLDEMGRELDFVKSFNTETGETEIFVTNTENKVLVDSKGPVVAKIVLKNAKLVDKEVEK